MLICSTGKNLERGSFLGCLNRNASAQSCGKEHQVLLQLQSMDLSRNRLDGTLPSSLARLAQVSHGAKTIIEKHLLLWGAAEKVLTCSYRAE